MKKILALILLFTLFSIPAFAADYYIAQTAAGSANGTSCANAYVYTWPWTGVNDGDTVHLCGTITSTLTIPESGTSAGITVKFETGANFTAAAWSTGSGAAIYANGKSYIIIDGGTNGIIQNTANGDSFANQQVSHGIDITGGAYWTIKNLTIQNIYVHVYNNASTTLGCGISTVDTSNISIYNNTMNNAYFAVALSNSSSAVSTFNIYSNIISACSTAIVVAPGGPSNSIDTVNIHDNTITMGLNWYDTPDNNHIDGMHIWGYPNTPTNQVTNLKIYNNNVGGDPSSHSTAGIYVEYGVIAPQIYNNVLWDVANHHAEGFIAIKGNSAITASNSKIYNNTMYGAGAGLCIYLAGSTGHDIKNNIMANTDYLITENDSNTTISASNYNDFYPTGNQSHDFSISGVSQTWAQWQTAGWDANSITTQPPFVSYSNFALTSSIPGTNLSTYFTTDITGATRSEWDMGAYEYGSVTPPSVTISTPSQTIPSNSLAISGTATQGTNPISSCAWSIGTPLSGTNAGTALTGTTSWSSSSNITSFSAGANTLYVGCVDNAGYWGNSSIVVTYTQVYNLSVVSLHGAVTSSPTGISCTDNGGTCNQSFPSESVTLTESPDASWTFASWTVTGVAVVSGCTTGSTCVVTTNAIGTVTANYTGTPWNVTVSQASVGSANGGIITNLGVNHVTGGNAQTTTATANNGWQILSTSWGGDGVTPYCGGSYSAPTFTSSAVTQDCSIKGTFSQIQLWPGTK